MSPAPGSDQEPLVLGNLLGILLSKFWWILGITAVIVALAAAYVYTATPIYSANAVVQVEQPDGSSSPLTPTASMASSLSGGTLPTPAEIEVLQSRDVLAPVVQQYKLAFSVTPQTLPVIGKIASLLATPGEPAAPWLGLNRYAWGGEIADVSSVDVPQRYENKKLTLLAEGGDHFVLMGPNNEMLADGRVGQPVHEGDVQITVKRLVANAGTRFTVVRQNELDAVQAFGSRMSVSEQGKQTGVISIALKGADPAMTAVLANAVADSYLRQHMERKQEEASRMLTFLDGELPRLRAQLGDAETKLSQYQQASGSFQPSQEAQLYLQGSIEYDRQLAQLRLQRIMLLQQYMPDHPSVVALEQQIGQIEAQKAVFEKRFHGMPVDEVNAMSLQRDVKVSQDVYELLLSKVQELSLTRAGMLGNVRILDRALRPANPIKPNKPLVLSGAVMMGLILGSLFVLARKRMTVGIEEPEVIEERFGVPVLGAIPLNADQLRWDQRYDRAGNGRRTILAKSTPKDTAVESLRSFRTSLQFALADAPNNLLSFVGPIPGTGKSFVSINVATLLAEAGQRVLLIDADMRRGHLNEYFGKPRLPGLSEMLSGDMTPAQVINETDINNLSVIWTGNLPDNPSELLGAASTRTMLQALGNDFDVVIIDTPPVLAVTDATLIGSIVGTSFLVLRSGMHSEREVTAAIKQMTQRRSHLIGCVFNAMPSRVARYGKYSGGHHHYVYRYEVETK